MPRDRNRLDQPLIREKGELRPASWDEALQRVATAFEPLRGQEHSFGVFSCSKATNEVNYLAQKFARSVMGTSNIDSCNRT